MALIDFNEFRIRINEKSTAIIIGSANAGIDEENFGVITELLDKIIENRVFQFLNNGDLLNTGYGSIATVSVMASKKGIRILTIQSDEGKAEPGSEYYPPASNAVYFTDTVYNSNGSVAWCASSDEGKLCGPLRKSLECIEDMEKKPILICFGGGLGSVFEEQTYRNIGIHTFIMVTKNVKKNVTSDDYSAVKPTEGYHVQCEWNSAFYHPKGYCLHKLKCGDCV